MRKIALLLVTCLLLFSVGGCYWDFSISYPEIHLADLPAYDMRPYVVLNQNKPDFTEADYGYTSYEKYSPLDALGRCGAATAIIGQDIMPKEERGAIGHIKPTGWQTVKYDFVDGKYLYN